MLQLPLAEIMRTLAEAQLGYVKREMVFSQDGVQQEAVAGIVVPMSGVKGEPFDKGASGETPGSGRTEPGWNELPKSMAELALLWSLSLKGKKCSVGWGNGQLRSPGPWEPVLFPSPGRYQLHCCTMSTLPHHLLLDSPPWVY